MHYVQQFKGLNWNGRKRDEGSLVIWQKEKGIHIGYRALTPAGSINHIFVASQIITKKIEQVIR